MGDKKNASQKMLDTIDATIRQLERRQRELQTQIDPETGKYSGRTESELAWISRNLSLAKSAKKEVQETLERAKSEEEKKKVMNVVALAMLIGAVNENLRLAEKKAKRELESGNPVNGFLGSVVEALFASNKFKYVTAEDVQDILEDEELQQMAAEDPSKLEREEMDYKAEYESMMSHTLHQAGLEEGENFEDNERIFREYLKKNNNFESALKQNEKNIREKILSNPEGNIPEEDVRFFAEVLEELTALSKITRETQEKFILEDSFEKGNGYTRELVDREKALSDKVNAYVEQKILKVQENIPLDPQDKIGLLHVELYKQAQMLKDPIARQVKRDQTLQRNNDLRCRMERWSVYQQLPQEDRPEILTESVEIKNRKAALAKLVRMEQTALKHSMVENEQLTEKQKKERKKELREGVGGLEDFTSSLAVEITQKLLEQLENSKSLKKGDLPTVRKSLAALVLHQMVVNDMRRPHEEPKYYYGALKDSITRDNFMEITAYLAENEDFRKAVDPLIKGKNIKENIYRFLANDFERDVARKVYAGTRARLDKEVEAEMEVNHGFLQRIGSLPKTKYPDQADEQHHPPAYLSVR